MLEDNAGNLWFLTDKGISKYDGYSFENYSTVDGLTDNVFFEGYINGADEMWLLAKNGTVTILNTTDLVFSKFKHNDILTQNKIYIPHKIMVHDNELFIRYLYAFDYLQISMTGKVIKKPIMDMSIVPYLVVKDHFFFHSKDSVDGSKNQILVQLEIEVMGFRFLILSKTYSFIIVIHYPS